MARIVKVAIMDRSFSPSKLKSVLELDMGDVDVVLGGRGYGKAFKQELRMKVAEECKKKRLHIDAINVSSDPNSLHGCELIVTVVPVELSKAAAAKHVKKKPVKIGDREIPPKAKLGFDPKEEK